MHARHANIPFAPGAHRLGYGSQRRLQIEDAEADAENIDSFDDHEIKRRQAKYKTGDQTPAKPDAPDARRFRWI
jgi:hypothetical protein